MDIALSILLVCLALGAVVGLLAGLLGIGGGLIIVPALLLLFTHWLALPLSTAMPMAIATSLSTIILTGWSSSRAHYKLGNIDVRIVFWCVIGISVGAVLGAQLASHLPGEQVKSIFAVLVILIALQMVFGRPSSRIARISWWILLTIGLVAGAISAFMGIGGGAILVPALMLFRVNIKAAIGCAAFCGFVIALFGSASFIAAGWGLAGLPQWAFGYIYLPATLGVVLTSVFTARIGAKISHKLNVVLLKRIFAGFLVIVSVQMLLG